MPGHSVRYLMLDNWKLIMKWLNIVTLLLLIVGGVNWGLVAMGGHEMDLVANLFGGDEAPLAKIVYGLVGLSALWQILPWVKSLSVGEPQAEAARRDASATH